AARRAGDRRQCPDGRCRPVPPLPARAGRRTARVDCAETRGRPPEYHPNAAGGSGAARRARARPVGAQLARMTPLTYVYGLVVSDRKPSPTRMPAGLPGASRVRLVEVDRGRYLAVADVMARDYGEQAINQRLSNLDWVSRAAMAHEAVLEAFASR